MLLMIRVCTVQAMIWKNIKKIIHLEAETDDKLTSKYITKAKMTVTVQVLLGVLVN